MLLRASFILYTYIGRMGSSPTLHRIMRTVRCVYAVPVACHNSNSSDFTFLSLTSILFFLHYVYGLRRRFHSHSAVGVALDQSLPEKMLQVFWKWLVGAFFPKTKCNTYSTSTLTLPSSSTACLRPAFDYCTICRTVSKQI